MEGLLSTGPTPSVSYALPLPYDPVIPVPDDLGHEPKILEKTRGAECSPPDILPPGCVES